MRHALCLIVGLALAATALAAEAELRPPPRPDRMPDGRPVVRPLPRPDRQALLPKQFRPVPRPPRAAAPAAPAVLPAEPEAATSAQPPHLAAALHRPLPRPAGAPTAAPAAPPAPSAHPAPPAEPAASTAANSYQVASMSYRPTPRPASLVVRTALSVPERAAPPQRSTPKPVPTPAPAAPRNVDIVMIGDSITAGGRWARRFPGVSIANRGVSGDTALKILARMDGILDTRPKRALLMFGINDIYNGVPVDRILRRYDRIVTILLARKIDVVIQSTLACSGPVCGEKLARVHVLNTGLKRLAKARGLPFIDINRGLSDRSGLKGVFSRDGVHLNGDGYATWYAMLRPYIRRA